MNRTKKLAEIAPKILISTNFIFREAGVAYDKKQFEVKLAPAYTKEHTPTFKKKIIGNKEQNNA